MKCEAICNAAPYRDGEERCAFTATISFKNGFNLCARHAGKHILTEAIANKEVRLLPRKIQPSALTPIKTITK